jgi:hypothetical protein
MNIRAALEGIFMKPASIGPMVFVGNKAVLTIVSALNDMNWDICWRYS